MKTYFERKNRKPRVLLLHQYYAYTGFYQFIIKSLKKVILPVVFLISALLFVDYFILDLTSIFTEKTKDYSRLGVFSLFFVSESILGLLPPELFIAWIKTLPNPLVHLSFLALLSYLGGCVSYFIGKGVIKFPSFKQAIEGKMKKHIVHLKKWGGFLIVIGALLPIPFSMVSIASGMINYKLSKYLLFGLFRFLRFYLFAIAIFSFMEN
ncbi:YqaA family protein [Marinifilum sp. RC60d5]|uniref:YqaA family protein n=1 Tax=Marinifilum sp. RC60d5 TaxID=3458414 RepID=UPI004035C9C3